MESRESCDDVFLDPTSDNEEERVERREPELDTFRNQWQSELNQRQSGVNQRQSGVNQKQESRGEVSHDPSGPQSERDVKAPDGPRRVSFAADVKPGCSFSFLHHRSRGRMSSSSSPTVSGSTSSSPTVSGSTSSSPTVSGSTSASVEGGRERGIGHMNSDPAISSSVEEEAKLWFEEGVIQEEAGRLYDAVACYRRATQLVPDIEFRLYRRMAPKLVSNPGTKDPADSLLDTNNNGTDGFIQLFTKLSINDRNQFIICSPDIVNDRDIVNGRDIVKSNLTSTLSTSGSTSLSSVEAPSSVHISSLPFEVIIHTLKYVVSSELDLWSLESIASTCRGFYIIARDEEIWKLACIKIWGSNVVSNHSLLSKYDNRWRNMYINKPRVNYHGVYISKTTYIRQGESAFQDRASSEYRPVHVVEYFRYLRFFPNGIALMMTSPDEPIVCIPKMRDQLRSGNSLSGKLAPSSSDPSDNDAIKNYLREVEKISSFDNLSANRNQASIIQGVYQLIEPASLIVVFKKVSFDSDTAPSGGRINNRRSNRRQADMIRTEQIFNLELEIRSSKNRRHNQLIWKNYVVEYEKSTHGVRVTSNFDTIRQPNKYPPFWYSRVKSYNNNNFINAPLE